MAIKLADARNQIEVICSIDDSVRCDEDTYKKYLETLDESLLDLDPESVPVRFVLKTTLDYKSTRQIKQDQVSMTKDGGMGVNMGYTMLEMRLCLIDVKDPSSPLLAFKKGPDGKADEDLIVRLDACGILSDLIVARQNAVKPVVSKKS